MQPHRQELVTAFIERYRLHLPGEHRVNLADLFNDFRPISIPHLSCASMVMRRKDRIPSDQSEEVWIRRELSMQEMRMSYVHELMHVVLGHQASLPLYSVDPWFYNKDEKEAWEAAAMVLIPRESFFQSPDVFWLSMVTHAPVWLIHLLPLTRQHFTFPTLPRPAIFL